MKYGPTARVLSGIFGCLMFAGMASAQIPQLTGAVSRKTHTTGGLVFDIPLPLTGAPGIECRSGGTATLVLTFDQPVVSGTAARTQGVGSVSGAPTFNGNAMTINMTGITDQQTIGVTVSNVTGAGGGVLPSAVVQFRTLIGDVNGNGQVTTTDVNLAMSRTNAPLNYSNYRSDTNASGNISTTDVNTIRGRTGRSVAGGAANNTAPVLSAISDQEAVSGQASSGIAFTVSDSESGPDRVHLSITASDLELVPPSNMALAGTGDARIASMTPVAGLVGEVVMTLRASDGMTTSTQTFNVTVIPAFKLYITLLRPQGGAQTLGTGAATLQLSGDETYAIFRYNYSNLTTPFSAAHIHGPADPGQAGDIIFDIDTATPEPDGSFKWVITQSGNTTPAEIVEAIKTGRTYLNVHSERYPNGEIRGHFNLATGSQTFTPPPPPPALPGGPVTTADAHRLLVQATYGPTTQAVQEVQALGIDVWIDDQFNKPQTLMSPIVQARVAGGETLSDDFVGNAWWKIANTAPDQLRQRIAFALSEFFVVSFKSDEIAGHADGVAVYYDLLGEHAFGNFRDALEAVTLSPIMGQYLDMRGNKKPNLTTGTNPNENYAREILQLFSAGVNNVHPDGTLKLGVDGLPLPTYNQDVVIGFSHVFTGWNWNQAGTSSSPPSNYLLPMTFVPNDHSTNSKLLLNGVQLPGFDNGVQELEAALDNIFNHPNVGPFVARQLIQRLICSDPSPPYIYRVASKFNDNGAGVRGDMKAVIKAVLTDYEARSTDILGNVGFGKQKEPLLRCTHIMRAFRAVSPSGKWLLGSTNTNLGQSPMRAETVFNFFEPDFIPAGVLGAAGLFAPEFQITTDTTAITSHNMIESGIRASSGFTSDIQVDLTVERDLAGDVNALLDHLNLVMMGGTMPTGMRAIIAGHVNGIGTLPLDNTEKLSRARAAIHLIATSPQYVTQK